MFFLFLEVTRLPLLLIHNAYNFYFHYLIVNVTFCLTKINLIKKIYFSRIAFIVFYDFYFIFHGYSLINSII